MFKDLFAAPTGHFSSGSGKKAHASFGSSWPPNVFFFLTFSSRQTGSTWAQRCPPHVLSAPHPLQHIISPTGGILCRLHEALPGRLLVNKHPSSERRWHWGSGLSSFCVNPPPTPRARRTGIRRRVVELLALRRLYTRSCDELNAFSLGWAGNQEQAAATHVQEVGGGAREGKKKRRLTKLCGDK